MTLIRSTPDDSQIQRRSMFDMAVRAAARHKFGLALNVAHMDPTTKEPHGWVREQCDHILLTWTTDDDTFPTFYFNQGIPLNEMWPVRDDRPITWREAVNSRKGLGRLAKLYVGGR